MPEFHETGYGRRFYEGQLPSLLHSLERIATALEKIANPPKLNIDKVEQAMFDYLLSEHGLTEDDAREDARQVVNVVFGTLKE